MALHPLAGKPAPASSLTDLAKLEREYYEHKIDAADPRQAVSFGTSGHRGTSAQRHVHRGPYPGHHAGDLRLPPRARHRRPALHGQGHARAVRPGAANGAGSAGRQRRRNDDPAATTAFTPTPVISRAILVYNRGAHRALADGIVITPSHNPPEDGGFKYNPPNGGPADTDVTSWIQDRANELLRAGNGGVKRVPSDAALKAATTHRARFRRCLMSKTCTT